MQTIGNMRRTGSTQLRIALAVVFFLVSSLQGTLFASAGSFGPTQSAAHHEMTVDIAGEHQHGHADHAAEPSQKHHGGKSMADKGCEVHCAPASAIPVNWVDIAHAVARCFAQSVPAVLVDGNYSEFIRPPRQLI